MFKVLACSFVCDTGFFTSGTLPELFTNELPNPNHFFLQQRTAIAFKIFINVWITGLIKPLNKCSNKNLVLINF